MTNILVTGNRKTGKSTYIKNDIIKIKKPDDLILVVDGCKGLDNFYKDLTPDEYIYDKLTDEIKNINEFNNVILVIDNIVSINKDYILDLLKNKQIRIYLVCQLYHQLNPSFRGQINKCVEL